MAKSLPVANAHENGKHPDGAVPQKVAALRTMLSTAEFWKEETASDLDVSEGAERHGAAGDAELDLLRQENGELRGQLEDLQRRLQEGGDEDSGWQERQREYEGLLEEKSEVIRGLHQKLQELQSRPAAPGLTPREDELIALSDELERERCQLEQDRREMTEERAQLKEDEKNMMQQMREMEVQMARERAELARQRNELQRLHTEVHHELELATRDAALRERLMPLQRRHQEMNHRRGGEPPREQPAPPQKALAKPAPATETGLLRRLFG